MRPRSLLPGVLGRGRERTSHPRARPLSSRPMCPASLPPASCHPRRSGITGTVEDPLEGGSCPNRTQRSPSTFHRATRTAESCGSVRRAQYSLPPLCPIWTLPTSPRPSARPEPHGRPFAGITVTRAHPDPDGTPHPATPSFSWTVTVLSGWPDIDRPGGWIVWTIMLRQPGSMSANTSPSHRFRPPSQQVRPTSPTRSRGPGRTCPPGSWRRHRCPACTGSSEASRCGRICPPCRVAGPGSAGRRWR